MALAHRVRTHQLVCLNIQTLQVLKAGNDQWGVNHNSFFFGLNYFGSNKSSGCARSMK
jgi:hypothetical protein